jgi:predicted PurR-regulated permease PerM
VRARALRTTAPCDRGGQLSRRIHAVGLENLLEPKLLGSSLDLHPLLVLFATASGGAVAGMIGLILVAPALAIGLDIKHELEASGFFADDP